MGLKTLNRETRSKSTFNVARYRKDFPVLHRSVNGHPLVYFDNAATSQKPQAVIDRVSRYYGEENANIHRGVFHLSEIATKAYEDVRRNVQQFVNAAASKEIIFVRGATEGINLAAQSFGRTFIQKGDEIIITAMEHHSNIVPWQVLCEQTGAKLVVAPINDEGELMIDEMSRLFNERTKFVSVVHVSNSLGTINPVKEIVKMSHACRVPVLIDGAQAVPHLKVDVQDLNCDFYVFSGHKVFGPTGVGVLYGKEGILDRMPPYQSGGDMISSVSFEKTSYNVLPHKFEAGTPNIAGVIGLGAAVDYVNEIGLDRISAYEHELLQYATKALSKVPKLRIIGTAKNKASVISFVLDDVHPHDIGTVLDQEGIAIRAGHHCTMPLMERFKVPATVRASLAFYNTREEIDRLVKAIGKVKEIFKL